VPAIRLAGRGVDDVTAVDDSAEEFDSGVGVFSVQRVCWGEVGEASGLVGSLLELVRVVVARLVGNRGGRLE